MITEKLFLLTELDDDGFIGATISVPIPSNIETYPDAIEYLKPVLSSKEFIKLMYTGDFEGWLDEIDEECELSDFELVNVSYVHGFCRWTFFNNELDEELIIEKTMEFVVNVKVD